MNPRVASWTAHWVATGVVAALCATFAVWSHRPGGFWDTRWLGAMLAGAIFAIYFLVATALVAWLRMGRTGVALAHALGLALAPCLLWGGISVKRAVSVARWNRDAAAARDLLAVARWSYVPGGQAIVEARADFNGTLRLGEFSVCRSRGACAYEARAFEDRRSVRRGELVRWELPLRAIDAIPAKEIFIRFYCDVEHEGSTRIRDFSTAASRRIGSDASLAVPLERAPTASGD